MFDERKFNAAIALKGETRGDAAKIMGIHPATLFRKTKGESDFRSKEISMFCKHYDVLPDDIFFENHST